MNIYELPKQWDTKQINKVVRRKFPDFALDKVEIQPATHCQLHCPWCYGKHLLPPANERKEVSCSMYVDNVLTPIAKYDPKIVIAGTHTEPLLYSDFIKLISTINEMGFRFSLYTNGINLTDEMCKAILTHSHTESSISINFSAVKYHFYYPLDKYHEMIRRFCELRDKLSPFFQVNVPMFLMWEVEEMLETQNKLLEDGVDVIRYRKPDFAFYPVQQLADDKIVFDSKPFNHCYSMCNALTIANNGEVYPCPHTANINFPHLCLGSILKEDIIKIWQNRYKMWHTFDPSKDLCECNHYDAEWNRLCSFLAKDK